LINPALVRKAKQTLGCCTAARWCSRLSKTAGVREDLSIGNRASLLQPAQMASPDHRNFLHILNEGRRITSADFPSLVFD
jgi:hypothetical protein